ncbi:MAG: signal peptidase I [Candidatus Kapabacteria bacterium]|nr:signal peptidase I [Candidatus Kapabacteria bacterium]
MALIESLYQRMGGFGAFMLKRRQARLDAPKPETLGEHLIAWVKTIVWSLTVVTIINGLALASFVVPTGSMESTVLAGEFLFVNKFIYGPSTPQIIPFLNQPLPYYKLPPVIAPKQGDVIVFVFPGNRDVITPTAFEYYLKRCVATAGDVLQIKGGRVFVNGNEYALPENAQFMGWTPEQRTMVCDADREATFPIGKGYTRDDYGPIRIPKEGDVIALTPENFREWAVFIAREGHTVDAAMGTIDGKPATSYTVKRDYVFGMGDNRDNSLDSRFWGFIPEEDVVGTPMIVYWSWAPNDPVYGTRMTFAQRLKSIRWSRFGTIIH